MMAVISAALMQLIPAAEGAPVVVAAKAIVDDSPSVFDMVFPLTMLLILGLVVPAALLGLNTIFSRFAPRHAQYQSWKKSAIRKWSARNAGHRRRTV